ncbi:hypothetical protein ACFE04_020553 [Oxalis oulophora]
MDYERIEKPSSSYSHDWESGGGGRLRGGEGGGFSPKKLRSMLVSGMDNTTTTSSSASSSDNCKDVDVVSVDVVSEIPQCSSSTTSSHSFPTPMPPTPTPQQHTLINIIKDHSFLTSQYHSSHDNTSTTTVSSSIFDFQKSSQTLPLRPFSKPPPSKWDDAHKWIASPIANNNPKPLPKLPRHSSAKLTFQEPADTKRIDHTTQPNNNFINWERESEMEMEMEMEMDPYPLHSYANPPLIIHNSIPQTAINLSCHDSSTTIRTATTFMPPPSTARSVSMRDMGTEMTPIASQEPSRTGTPVRATTPIRSPNSSPTRAAPTSSPINSLVSHADLNKDLSEKELQMKTRREIIALGTQLGKMNIAAWASKEEEDKDASTSLKKVPTDHPNKNIVEVRAASWEAAEKAKYMARFKREEMKIQAWENHQKAKTEAEMRKIEVEVERMRGGAQDKLMNKLAAARHKAEEKRASAEAKRNHQAAITEQEADYIRKTGRIPASFSCLGCTSFSFCGWCK